MKLGYDMLPRNEKRVLANAIGRREAYLNGYKKPFAGSTVMQWYAEHQKAERKAVDGEREAYRRIDAMKQQLVECEEREQAANKSLAQAMETVRACQASEEKSKV